jgi:gliding motility-associated-like protein
VVVQPRPKLTASATNVTVCEDVALAVNLSSTSNPSTGGGYGPVEHDLLSVTGFTAGISGFTNPAGANFAKASTLADVLTTTDLNQQQIVYKFRPQFAVPASVNASGFCLGNETDITVTVSPRARMNAIAAAPIQLCTGEQLERTITVAEADPSNTVITWAAAAPANVTGASSGGGDLLSQILFNRNADPRTVTYSFTTNSFGCTRPGPALNVEVYPLPKLSGLSTVNICNGAPFAVALQAAPGPNAFTSDVNNTQFRWTVDSPADLSGGAPFNGPATSVNQVLTNSGTSLGTYTYVFTPYVIRADGQECVGQQDKVVSVNVAPPVAGTLFSSDGDADSYLCKGNKDFVFFDFQGLPLFEAVYSDGTQDITLTKQGAIKVLQVSPTATTTYTLKSLKDGFGCTVNPVGQAVTVNVGETNASFSVVGPEIACSPYQVQFQHNQVNGVQYTWKWFDGVADSVYTATANQNGQIVRHTFLNPSPNGQVRYKVFLETRLDDNYPGNCLKTSFQEVKVYPTVAPAVFPDRTVICSDERITFVNSSQGVTQHRWFYRVQGSAAEFDVRSTSNTNYQLRNISASNPIVYEVVYQSTNGNCPAPDVVTPITVYRGVDAQFTYTDPTLFIGGHSYTTFTNTSAPVDGSDFRYEWDFGLDANPQATTGIGPFALDYTTPGPKEVALRAVNIVAEGAGLTCTDEYRTLIQIAVPPLVADFVATPLEACFPSDVEVVENLATGDVFEWRVFDELGKTAATSNANLPVFTLASPGKYTIELTTRNSFTGDQKTALRDLVIYPLPVASFDMRPNVVFVPDTELSTFNFSSGATEYEWDFGDGTVLFEEEPKHKYRIEGLYDVLLIAKNDHGNGVVCVDSLSRPVVAKQGGVTKVPNAFTPNPNGPNGGRPGNNSFNDVFLPQVKGAEEFNMQIFDRWGNLIFESNDATMGWDGYDRNGRLLPAGVYVYKLTLRLSDGQRTTQLGDITMIR